ncbi:YlxR family protein [Nocardioides pakistanensis]
MRTCVGCRVRAPKQELLRVVASGSVGDQLVVPDPGARAPGRGAYIHPTLECLELATRRRAFARALRVRGGLDEAPVRDHLQLAHDN